MAKESSYTSDINAAEKIAGVFSNPIERDLFYGQFRRRRIAYILIYLYTVVDIYAPLNQIPTYLLVTNTRTHIIRESYIRPIASYRFEFVEFTRFKIRNILTPNTPYYDIPI